MRQAIRQAYSEGYKRIAFVCGAWHAPALVDLPGAAEDEQLLKDLAEVEVDATWVPWTYGRLSMSSGYGAGIQSPGWYHHLWQRANEGDSVRETAAGWLSSTRSATRWKNT